MRKGWSFLVVCGAVGIVPSVSAGREGLPEGAAITTFAVAPTAIRRLTRDEIVNVLRDTLAYDASSERLLPRDPDTAEFRNGRETLLPTDADVGAMARAAHRIAHDVGGDVLVRLAGCTQTSRTCGASFVQTLGERLFRRPLRPTQLRAYTNLVRAGTRGADFLTGARLALEAMLQAPDFLYAVDVPAQEPGRVDGFTRATRLSLLIWKSAPDADLLAAAAAGTLDTLDGVQRTAARMLKDPRARRGLLSFAEDWLGLYRLDTAFRIRHAYPAFSPALMQQMKEQTLRFVAAVVYDEGGDMMDLLSDPRTELTPELAALYEVPSRGDGFRPYQLPEDSPRLGLLTQPAVLSVFAGVEKATIVNRGLYVMKTFLCESVPPPPDDVANVFKNIPDELPEREKFDLHTGSPSCAGCHLDIDPLGYPFEPFDALGRHHVQDRHGHRIASDGDVYLAGDLQHFQNTRDFVALLRESPEVRRCLARKYHQYAAGRDLETPDLELVDETLARIGTSADPRLTYRRLVLETVGTDWFVRSEASPGAIQ